MRIHRLKHALFTLLLMVITAPAIYSLELSLSRQSYDLLQLDRDYIDVRLSVSAKEDVGAASITVGAHPFQLLEVRALDANFRVTHQKDAGRLLLDIQRVAEGAESGEEWINIRLSTERENETFFSDFGVFPIFDAEIIGRSGEAISDVQTRNGGWIFNTNDGDIIRFFSLPVRVVDKNDSPVSNVLVVYELIGNAGIAEGRITDANGKVDLVHPPTQFFPESVYPPVDTILSPYDFEAFMERSSFIGKYVGPECFTVRFLVFSIEDNTSFSEPYLFNRTLCFYSDGLHFAEGTLVLSESSSNAKHWMLYR